MVTVATDVGFTAATDASYALWMAYWCSVPIGSKALFIAVYQKLIQLVIRFPTFDMLTWRDFAYLYVWKSWWHSASTALIISQKLKQVNFTFLLTFYKSLGVAGDRAYYLEATGPKLPTNCANVHKKLFTIQHCQKEISNEQ